MFASLILSLPCAPRGAKAKTDRARGSSGRDFRATASRRARCRNEADIWSSVMNVMTKTNPFELSALPYDENALEPVISAQTMRFHHGKHHKAYVDKLNELVKGTEFARMQLEDVVKATFRASDHTKQKIFNKARQDWNHTFFWACLTPKSGKPKGTLLTAIERDLGGLDAFKRKFAEEGVEQFGSGWVWVRSDHGKPKIEETPGD